MWERRSGGLPERGPSKTGNKRKLRNIYLGCAARRTVPGHYTLLASIRAQGRGIARRRRKVVMVSPCATSRIGSFPHARQRCSLVGRQIALVEDFTDRAEALKAAGVEE